ncbi:MAG: hypothetical protein RR347_09415 [Anaerovoracaceae bacterium]
MFAFTLTTKSKLEEQHSLFSTDGDIIGRIIYKTPNFKDEYDEYEYKGTYSYHIESDESKYNALLDKKIIVAYADDYAVSSCNTYYIRKDC